MDDPNLPRVILVAHRFASHEQSGIPRYVAELCRELSADPACRGYALVTPPEAGDPSGCGLPVERLRGGRRAVQLGWHLAGRPPLERLVPPADLVHALYPFAPVPTRAPLVATVHDLLPLQFPEWFGRVTPLEELGQLPLGSRPARRGVAVSSLEDLRAIPWVFAWSQARVNAPGWYGLGTALSAVGDVGLLQDANQNWPLFQVMLENAEMSLAKTDRRILGRYLELGDRPDLTQQMLDEHALTTEWVLKVLGEERLLQGRRVLGRAVELRNPYVDALSYLQLRALRTLRTDDSLDEEQIVRTRRLLLLTVSGVAAGLQNTG